MVKANNTKRNIT